MYSYAMCDACDMYNIKVIFSQPCACRQARFSILLVGVVCGCHRHNHHLHPCHYYLKPSFIFATFTLQFPVKGRTALNPIICIHCLHCRKHTRAHQNPYTRKNTSRISQALFFFSFLLLLMPNLTWPDTVDGDRGCVRSGMRSTGTTCRILLCHVDGCMYITNINIYAYSFTYTWASISYNINESRI